MAPLTIEVPGVSSVAYRPERGTVSITVKSQGPEQAPVSSEVTETSNSLNTWFTQLSPKLESGVATPDAPVTVFSSNLLRTRSTVPVDGNRNPLPPVYHATITFNVIFRDFATMGEVIGKLVTYPKVEIQSIYWTLTEATQKALGSETRKQAIRDAIQKANDYAEVLGRDVIAVEIRDGGQGSGSPNSRFVTQQMPAQSPMGMMARSSRRDDSEAGTTSLDLTPQDVRYSGSVSVKFEAI